MTVEINERKRTCEILYLIFSKHVVIFEYIEDWISGKIQIHVIVNGPDCFFPAQKQEFEGRGHFVLQTIKLSPTKPCMNNLPRVASCTAEVIPEIFVPSSSNTFSTEYFSP